jgi:hypothetical protein
VTSNPTSSTGDAAAATAATGMGSVVTSATTQVTLNQEPGSSASAPDGSTCRTGSSEYTYDLTTTSLTFSLCAPGAAGGANTLQSGFKLSTSDAAALLATLRAITADATGAASGCSADTTAYTANVESASGLALYVDKTTACAATSDTPATGVIDAYQLAASIGAAAGDVG